LQQRPRPIAPGLSRRPCAAAYGPGPSVFTIRARKTDTDRASVSQAVALRGDPAASANQCRSGPVGAVTVAHPGPTQASFRRLQDLLPSPARNGRRPLAPIVPPKGHGGDGTPKRGGRRPRPDAGEETEDARRFVGGGRGAGSAPSAEDQGRLQRRFRQLSTAGRSRPRDRSRGHVVRLVMRRPLEPPSLLPLAAQALTLLGRKLPEAPPLLSEPLPFLGREVPELPEAFPECLAPLRRQLAPASGAFPEAFLFLR